MCRGGLYGRGLTRLERASNWFAGSLHILAWRIEAWVIASTRSHLLAEVKKRTDRIGPSRPLGGK